MNTGKDATAPRSLTTGLNSAQVRLLAALAVTLGVWSLCLIGMSVMRSELEAGIAQTQLATVQQLADQLDRKLRDRLEGLAGAAGLPAPKTWSDLMKPEWKGKFAITDPSKSDTAYLLVYGLLKQFGREGLEKIAANAVVTSSSGTTYKGTAMGEYAVGLTIEYAAQEYVAGGQKEIKLVYPSEGSYLAPEGMFILKGAKNAEAAKTFYNILLSKETQQQLLVKAFRRPTRNDIPVAKLTSLPDLKSVKIFALDQAAASAEYEQLISLWNLAVSKAR
jgi:ABC-type Fe3+ transport system substrate-binding protein